MKFLSGLLPFFKLKLFLEFGDARDPFACMLLLYIYFIRSRNCFWIIIIILSSLINCCFVLLVHFCRTANRPFTDLSLLCWSHLHWRRRSRFCYCCDKMRIFFELKRVVVKIYHLTRIRIKNLVANSLYSPLLQNIQYGIAKCFLFLNQLVLLYFLFEFLF